MLGGRRDARPRLRNGGEYLQDLRDAREPEARLLSGIDGAAVLEARDGLAKLGRQVAQTVDWAACRIARVATPSTRI